MPMPTSVCPTVAELSTRLICSPCEFSNDDLSKINRHFSDKMEEKDVDRLDELSLDYTHTVPSFLHIFLNDEQVQNLPKRKFPDELQTKIRALTEVLFPDTTEELWLQVFEKVRRRVQNEKALKARKARK